MHVLLAIELQNLIEHVPSHLGDNVFIGKFSFCTKCVQEKKNNEKDQTDYLHSSITMDGWWRLPSSPAPPLKGATTKQQQNNTDQLDERRPLGRTVTTLLNVTVRRVPF